MKTKTVIELEKMLYVDYVGTFKAYFDGENYYNCVGVLLPTPDQFDLENSYLSLMGE